MKKKISSHPTRSFDQMVSDESLKRYQGYIDESIRQGEAKLAKSQLESSAMILKRLIALESLLADKVGITSADIVNKVMEIEDAALGYEGAGPDASVQAGNALRIQYQSKLSTEENFSPVKKLNLYRVNTEPFEINKDLESQIIGMKKGETKQIDINVPVVGKEELMTVNFQITVDRISLKLEPVAAEQGAGESNAESNQVSGQ